MLTGWVLIYSTAEIEPSLPDNRFFRWTFFLDDPLFLGLPFSHVTPSNTVFPFRHFVTKVDGLTVDDKRWF
jgi:hypothetical protein